MPLKGGVAHEQVRFFRAALSRDCVNPVLQGMRKAATTL